MLTMNVFISLLMLFKLLCKLKAVMRTRHKGRLISIIDGSKQLLYTLRSSKLLF
jgi:hypothetical protein